MTFLDFIALGLAAWRVSSLLVNEAGPWDIFCRARCLLGVSHGPTGLPEAWTGEGLGALFSCVWCMSVWMGGLMYLVWWLSPVPIYILAVSALAVIVNESIERLKR